MSENNNLKKDNQNTRNQKIIQEKNSLFNKSNFEFINIKICENKLKKGKKDIFERNASLLKLFPSKSQFINIEDFKLAQDISQKGRINSFKSNNFLPNHRIKSNSLLNQKKNYFYCAYNKTNKKKKINNYSPNINLNDSKKDIMIDSLHDKEIDICLNIINSLPEKTRNKRLNNINIYKSQKSYDLIKSKKYFSIDNINNQEILDSQMLNTYINNNISFNSELNILNNNFVLSKPNIFNINNNPLNNIDRSNITNILNKKNLSDTAISLNNNMEINKLNDGSLLNSNNSVNWMINKNTKKSKMLKSLNNEMNNISKDNIQNTLKKYQKNPINFRTGFIRSQKKIYGDVYSEYFKNYKNKKIKFENNINKKDDRNKLLLLEINEYKAIIKDIEKKKSKTVRKNQSNFNTIKEEKNLDSKDKLIEELNKIYLNQKNLFLKYLKENKNNEKIFTDLYKQKVNKNIQSINNIKRGTNIFVDGYSLLDGKINKKLNHYKNILGNKFYDKAQKMEKIEKIYQTFDKYENIIKNNENEIFKKAHLYKELFKPKFYFNKDKRESLTNYNKNKLNNNKTSSYSKITIDSSKTFKMDNIKNSSINSNNQDDQIYNDEY